MYQTHNLTLPHYNSSQVLACALESALFLAVSQPLWQPNASSTPALSCQAHHYLQPHWRLLQHTARSHDSHFQPYLLSHSGALAAHCARYGMNSALVCGAPC